MTITVIILKILIILFPLILSIKFNYDRWLVYYDRKNNIKNFFRYSVLRFILNEKASDDHLILSGVKIFAIIIWMLMCIALFYN